VRRCVRLARDVNIISNDAHKQVKKKLNNISGFITHVSPLFSSNLEVNGNKK